MIYLRVKKNVKIFKNKKIININILIIRQFVKIYTGCFPGTMAQPERKRI